VAETKRLEQERLGPLPTLDDGDLNEGGDEKNDFDDSQTTDVVVDVDGYKKMLKKGGYKNINREDLIDQLETDKYRLERKIKRMKKKHKSTSKYKK